MGLDKYDITGVGIDLTGVDAVDWRAMFGNEHPVELEIGTGKAAYLLRRAQTHPERNFFGIEWANKFYMFAADRMRRWGLSNVRMARIDADHFIKVLCPRSSLEVLHIYHPDPWPKARHHRRRLIQPAFVAAASSCLVLGGRIAVQTDHAEYFEQIEAVLRGQTGLMETGFDDLQPPEQVGLETNFERKYRVEGRAFYRIAMRREGA